MQYNAMQYDAMQYHAKQSKTIQYLQYKEIPCNTLFKSFKTSTGPMGFVFSSWMVPYGSDSAGRGKCLIYVHFFLKVDASCDQTL